ncbi:response regulator transcription factor [Pseudobacteroides cellulosolvens]|uniref:Stage 0 sporulation protein A homolog n=1 Tax=Pseudobacteroides cellulosolvens ATCC 35603 = DSM 2933 TaxID=398512 RepID=A0A0L6JHB2_9FIRM|nr:response regulator transcription factor [Pseudobacteroides cellulosolvens]KNY25114.1 two component transcriptional regulator, LuxR family [Pseudobacteroides cellulosolvens ATCC 35603 = DSM 2933]
MIKVLIVDDQAMLRQSLKFIIEQDLGIKVEATAGNGEDAFKLCGELKPDVVLMDIMMPVCDGIEGTRLIKSKYPNIKVIILTTFNNDENIKNALQNGAAGYLLKDADPEDLILAIKSVAKGMSIIHHDVFDNVVKKVGDIESDKPAINNNPSIHFTDRELDVIRLIIDGKSNKEIGAELFITEGSVKNIITGTLDKAGLKDRTQLAVYAIKNHIV